MMKNFMKSLKRIYGLVARHVTLMPRNFTRWMDMFYWPMMDLMVWGYTTVYLNSHSSGKIDFVLLFVGALISWDILFRAQQSVTVTFLEDVWARNILNIFVSPLSPLEFLTAAITYGMIKHFITISFMSMIAFWLYNYNYFSLGFALIPAILNLLIFGWCIGIVATAIILRFGQSAEIVAWGLAFLFQPFSGVFYPVETLPKAAQIFSAILPTSYVFAELRSIVLTKAYDPLLMWKALSLNMAYLMATGLFFNWMWKGVKKRGLLTKFEVY